jgi:hypothetical protein
MIQGICDGSTTRQFDAGWRAGPTQCPHRQARRDGLTHACLNWRLRDMHSRAVSDEVGRTSYRADKFVAVTIEIGTETPRETWKVLAELNVVGMPLDAVRQAT